MSVTDAKDRITILLAEYNALRAQMLQRNTIINQMVVLSGTLAAAVASLVATSHYLIALILIILVPPMILAIYRLNKSDLMVTVERLEEIRLEVNDLAGGKPLLKSETATGWSTMGSAAAFRRAARPFDRLGDWIDRFWRQYISPN